MEIPVSYPGFVNQRLAVKSADLLRGPRLLLNGSPLKSKRGLRYVVKNDEGVEVPIEFKITFLIFLEPVPNLKIGNAIIQLVKPLTWYEYCLSALPIILMFVGGALGGLIGCYVAHCNGLIFRSARKEWQKYILVAILSLGSVIAYIVLASAIRLYLGQR